MVDARIKFSDEWDKLKSNKFKVGNIFTTFRRYKPEKYDYYKNHIGKEFNVLLGKKYLGTAILENCIKKRSIDIRINEIKRDTYEKYSVDDFNNLMIKFYGTSNFLGLWLTFKIKKVNVLNKKYYIQCDFK